MRRRKSKRQTNKAIRSHGQNPGGRHDKKNPRGKCGSLPAASGWNCTEKKGLDTWTRPSLVTSLMLTK